jgi:hypothetical protein
LLRNLDERLHSTGKTLKQLSEVLRHQAWPRGVALLLEPEPDTEPASLDGVTLSTDHRVAAMFEDQLDRFVLGRRSGLLFLHIEAEAGSAKTFLVQTLILRTRACLAGTQYRPIVTAYTARIATRLGCTTVHKALRMKI